MNTHQLQSQKADMNPVQRKGVLLQDVEDEDPFNVDGGSPINFNPPPSLHGAESLQNPLTN